MSESSRSRSGSSSRGKPAEKDSVEQTPSSPHLNGSKIRVTTAKQNTKVTPGPSAPRQKASPAVLKRFTSVIEKLSVSEKDLWEGHAAIWPVLKHFSNEFVAASDPAQIVMIKVALPKLKAFSGVPSRNYRFPVSTRIDKLISVICKRFKVKGAKSFGLTSMKGQRLENASTLSSYGLGSVLPFWQLKLIRKNKSSKKGNAKSTDTPNSGKSDSATSSRSSSKVLDANTKKSQLGSSMLKEPASSAKSPSKSKEDSSSKSKRVPTSLDKVATEQTKSPNKESRSAKSSDEKHHHPRSEGPTSSRRSSSRHHNSGSSAPVDSKDKERSSRRRDKERSGDNDKERDRSDKDKEREKPRDNDKEIDSKYKDNDRHNHHRHRGDKKTGDNPRKSSHSSRSHRHVSTEASSPTASPTKSSTRSDIASSVSSNPRSDPAVTSPTRSSRAPSISSRSHDSPSRSGSRALDVSKVYSVLFIIYEGNKNKAVRGSMPATTKFKDCVRKLAEHIKNANAASEMLCTSLDEKVTFHPQSLLKAYGVGDKITSLEVIVKQVDAKHFKTLEDTAQPREYGWIMMDDLASKVGNNDLRKIVYDLDCKIGTYRSRSLEDRLYEKDKLLRQTEQRLKESRRQEEELSGQVDALQSTLDTLKKTSKETGNTAIANIEVQEQLDQVTQRMLLTRKQLAAAQEASEAMQKEFEEELQEQKRVTIRMRADHAEEIEKYEHYMARLLGSHELLSADLQDMRNEMFEHTQKAKGVERERDSLREEVEMLRAQLSVSNMALASVQTAVSTPRSVEALLPHTVVEQIPTIIVSAGGSPPPPPPPPPPPSASSLSTALSTNKTAASIVGSTSDSRPSLADLTSIKLKTVTESSTQAAASSSKGPVDMIDELKSFKLSALKATPALQEKALPRTLSSHSLLANEIINFSKSQLRKNSDTPADRKPKSMGTGFGSDDFLTNALQKRFASMNLDDEDAEDWDDQSMSTENDEDGWDDGSDEDQDLEDNEEDEEEEDDYDYDEVEEQYDDFFL